MKRFLHYTTEDLHNLKSDFSLILQNEYWFRTGLCEWIHNIYGSKNKFKNINLLERYLKSNRPITLNRLFTPSVYWWKKGDIVPRVKWIKKQIKLIDKELDFRWHEDNCEDATI